jgi:hypothetical protein
MVMAFTSWFSDRSRRVGNRSLIDGSAARRNA